MEFIYADKLKTLFSVFGHFYDLQIGDRTFNCRSVLEIVSTFIDDPFNSKPCAVVVMMNPGSSKPLSSDYKPNKFSINEITSEDWKKELIPSWPDNAQYQIMRLMLFKEWKHVRILNLSDLRNGNSGKFSVEFKGAEQLDLSNPHSITHEHRHRELLKYCDEIQIVIAAWGTNEVLRKIAANFLRVIPNVQGLELEYPWYRYPSPYKKDQKLHWLKRINSSLYSCTQIVIRRDLTPS